MLGSTSVFDIPLLLDMVCVRLGPTDIKNCTVCSKAWYSHFGPYRLNFVRVNNNPDRTLFLLENSCHIRNLELNLTDLETFISPHCTRLRTLAMGFVYENGEESDEDDLNDVEHNELDAIDGADPSTTKTNKPVCASELIQRNPGLRTLHVAQGGSREQPLRPIAKSILQAVANHPFLTTIKITMKLTCPVLPKILSHLPRQLQELDIGVDVDDHRHHKRCDRQVRLFNSQGTSLGLRRLIHRGHMPCFIQRLFLPLLRRCPELEELTFPTMNEWQDFAGLAQVLNSHCRRLHTLNQEYRRWSTVSQTLICAILQGFSEGIRELRLLDIYWRQEDSILEKIVTTASVDTIEVVRMHPAYDTSDHIIGVLKQCSRLREFQWYGGHGDFRGADISDLVLSMYEPWKCRDTLEVLVLKVCNGKAIHQQSYAKARRRKTAQDTRELCFWLRTFPKLVTLDLRWRLMATLKKPCSDISLAELNEGAVKRGTTLMTPDDMRWVGL